MRANTKLHNAHEFDAVPQSAISLAGLARCDTNFLAPEIAKISVDVNPLPASVTVPREAGLLYFGVRSAYILGLQIGSILSRLNRRSFSKSGS